MTKYCDSLTIKNLGYNNRTSYWDVAVLTKRNAETNYSRVRSYGVRAILGMTPAAWLHGGLGCGCFEQNLADVQTTVVRC